MRGKREQDYEDESEVVHWYETAPDSLPSDVESKEEVDQFKLKQRGQELLEKLGDSQSKKNAYSEENWMHKISKAGTTKDKLTAGTILIKEKPLSNIRTLTTLIAQAKKKAGRANIPVVETLKDLFLLDLLPPERKLKYKKKINSYSNTIIFNLF